MCQSLVLNYGMSHSQTMGPSYDGFLTTVSSCLLTASILLACYLLSAKSIGLLRSSLFVSTTLGVELTRFWPVKKLAELADV